MSFHSRNLPHWIPESASIFVTWRLYGSLPCGTVALDCAPRANLHERKPIEYPKSTGKSACATEEESAGERFRRMDMQLDSMRGGARWLENPKIAGCVEDALVRGEASLRQYGLHAYVVMPNHVHILMTPSISVSEIMREIKGVSARDANRILGRRGKVFWQDESFDHWVRSEEEFWRIVAYIENNPVTAQLVSKAEEWRWSSAAVRGKK